MSTQEERELVKTRLMSISPTVVFTTLSGIQLSRDDALREISAGSKEGDLIVETQMRYLRGLKQI